VTQRKPAGVSWESWIEEQIRRTREDGGFSELPGKGKPLPDIGRGYDPLWWIKGLIRREQLSDLPPALEIRRRVEREMTELARLDREAEVRRRLVALNAEIAKVNRSTASGPPPNLGLLDVEEIISEWRKAKG
jgi:hypothetical protein